MNILQTEIEGRLSDLVPRGVRREVARITAIYESVVYGYFNADDERKSPQFTTLLIQSALDEASPEVGDAHWREMNRLREESRAGKSGTVQGNVLKAVEKAESELAEVKHIISQMPEIRIFARKVIAQRQAKAA